MLRTRFHLFRKFWAYFWRSLTIYDIHSPFIFDFTKSIIEDQRQFYAFSDIQMLRNQLLEQKNTITIEDHGAGSKAVPTQQRTIRSIAQFGAVNRRIGQYLFKIALWHKPQTILEFGTSLGISSLYLASYDSRATVTTVEGCPNTAALAKKHFQILKRFNIQPHQQTFDVWITHSLAQHQHFDLVFFDGNHQAGATVRYYEAIKPYLKETSILIVADIYWSKEMESAWNVLKEQPEVTTTIDLYHLGVLFFSKNHPQKSHYSIVPWSWKPWRLGFFTKIPK